MKRINETGKRFGHWTVLEYLGHKKYLCKCDCGKQSTVFVHSLRNGQSTNCGCQPKNRLNYGEASFNNKYLKYKCNARYRNINFDLTKEEFKLIIDKNCYYCNQNPISTDYGHKSYYGTYKSNGIDRIDNDKGYFFDNCVPCCFGCNRLKGTLDVKSFIDRIKKIYKYFKENKTTHEGN